MTALNFPLAKRNVTQPCEIAPPTLNPTPKDCDRDVSDISNQISGIANSGNLSNNSHPPQNMRKDDDTRKDLFSRQEEESGTRARYYCKICQYESPTIGGIKTHITRSHKAVAVKKEKVVCRMWYERNASWLEDEGLIDLSKINKCILNDTTIFPPKRSREVQQRITKVMEQNTKNVKK